MPGGPATRFDMVKEYYYHIDNGGLWIRRHPGNIKEVPHLEFFNSFHGHAGNSMKISNPSSKMLREIAEFLMVQASEMDKENKNA